MTALHSDVSNYEFQGETIVKARTTYSFGWTLKKFSKFKLGTEKKSPTFHPLPNQAFYAVLKISEILSGYLYIYHISGTNIEVKFNTSIETITGQVVLKNSTLHKYSDNISYCDVLPSCSTEMEKAREENVLIIKCVMEFLGEDKTDVCHNRPCSIPVVTLLDDLSALSAELKAAYDKQLYTDVSLKVDEDIVAVHKVIVCGRSSVFARMFETPMGEKEKNVVDIPDLELPVLKDLVSYLYAGVLAKDDFESVYALYYAADRYDVPSLRKKCATVLISKLDVENACRVLTLAHNHSDVEFKNATMELVKFSFDKILETDAWEELVRNAPRLAAEVISAWSKNRTTKVYRA